MKNVHDRFARLGLIAQILRSPEGRQRYDVSDLGRGEGGREGIDLEETYADMLLHF